MSNEQAELDLPRFLCGPEGLEPTVKARSRMLEQGAGVCAQIHLSPAGTLVLSLPSAQLGLVRTKLGATLGTLTVHYCQVDPYGRVTFDCFLPTKMVMSYSHLV